MVKCSRNDGTFELQVHIADVAVCAEGTALDLELGCGNIVYLPDRAIPMLPQYSHCECSLRPDEQGWCCLA